MPKYRFEYTYTGFHPNYGNHVESNVKYFNTQKEVRQFAYCSPIGYCMLNYSGKVYDADGRYIATISHNRWESARTGKSTYFDGRGNLSKR